jgi:hypothetical protein
MGISYHDFMFMMTPYEFSVALKLYKRNEEVKEMDSRYRFGFERLMTISSINPHVKNKIKSPEEFFKFWWEKDNNREQMFEDINNVDVQAMFGKQE